MLIVRAWLEQDNGNQLRTRITRSLDVARRGEIVSSAATVDDVCSTIRAWLEEFIS
jgi:uncharacterized protein YbjT (DUF2867 family)